MNRNQTLSARKPTPHHLTAKLFRMICLCALLNGFSIVPLALQSAQAQTAVIAPTDTWVLLATEQLDATARTISITVGEKPGAFKALRLRSPVDAVTVTAVDIVYGDGRTHREDRKISLLAGERTRPIDLQPSDRSVTRVSLAVQPDAKSTRSRSLQIWGLQSKATEPARDARPAPAVSGEPPPAPSAAAIGPKPKPTPTATPPKPISIAAAARLPGKVSESPDLLIGAHYINFDVDRDVIAIGQQVGKFKRLRLSVQHRDVFVERITVRYADARAQVFDVARLIPASAITDWFDVDASAFVQSIQLAYRTREGVRDQARVEVFGEYSDGWLGVDGEGHKHNQGWVLLAAQSAGFVGFDEDTIPVGQNAGGFNKLRITVRDRAISLKDLKVVYADGSADLIPIRARVDAGSTYGPVTIASDGKAVAEIRADYRSRFIDRAAKGQGSAVVEFWAKR